MEAGSDAGENGEATFDGVSNLHKAKFTKAPKGKASVVVADGDEDDDAPMLVDPQFENLQAVLDKADVVLEVLDARDPLSYRSSHLEKTAASEQTVLILNKIGATLDELSLIIHLIADLFCARHVPKGSRLFVGSPSENFTSNAALPLRFCFPPVCI